MLKKQISLEANKLYNETEKVEGDLLEAKQNLDVAKKEHQQVSESLEQFMFEFTYDVAMNDPEMAKPVDPRTGRTNQGWTDILMERKLEEQDEYIEFRAELFTAQEAMRDLQHQVDIGLEKRRSIDNRIRLLEVMAKVVGDE